MPKVFICYRRDDSIDTAGRIYSWLKMRLPEGDVFFDVNTISPGSNFRTAIAAALASEVQVALVIIGRQWIQSPADDGGTRRRLDEDDDHVRTEIELALQYHKFVIPVLVQSARAPRRDELPASIADLADINAIQVRPEPDFDNDMRRLRSAILDHIPSVPFGPPVVYSPMNPNVRLPPSRDTGLASSESDGGPVGQGGTRRRTGLAARIRGLFQR